jgi:hypothetical protein
MKSTATNIRRLTAFIVVALLSARAYTAIGQPIVQYN